MWLASAYKSLPLDILLCIAKATPAASSFPTSSIPATPVSLPFSLTASALGVDVKRNAPGLTGVWGWRNEKNGRGDWGPRLCSWEFLLLVHIFSGYSLGHLGDISFLFVINTIQSASAGMKHTFLFTSTWEFADGELCTQVFHCVL